MDPVKRKAIAKEFQEFSADKLYWNTISGSPFYMVAQPWMKEYVYNAESTTPSSRCTTTRCGSTSRAAGERAARGLRPQGAKNAASGTAAACSVNGNTERPE